MADIAETVVDDALAEILTALEQIEPLLEGLKDFQRLNLNPDTMSIINATIAEHEQRQAKLSASRDSHRALLADGHPFLPKHEIPQAAYSDLAANDNSISVAFAHFMPETAADLGLKAGEKQPKAS